MTPLISFQNVHLIRQGKPLLTQLNWEVQPGEHWAILGLNGAGKSSLLRILTGEFWPSQGLVEVLGHRFGQSDMTTLRQKIGVVSSFMAERLPSDMKTEQIVLTGKYKSSILYKVYGKAELDEARAMLTQLGAEVLIGRTYASLSQGEKQITLVARSLMESPQLLILDEATAGLDLLARETLLERLSHISQLPKAPLMLYVTHHVEEITSNVSHVMLLKSGQISAQGRKEEILTTERLQDFYGQVVDILPLGQERIFVQPRLEK